MSTNMLEVGYLSDEEVAPRLASEEKMCKGPVAIIECVQDIPCNPCEEACPFKAINVGTPITSLPKLDENKCVGCGACIAKCPGLAIFVVDMSKPGTTASVQMPYEYYPLPQKGDVVWGVDRKGQAIAKALVEKVVTRKEFDFTAVITLEIPKQYANMVRCMRPLGDGE